MSTYPYIVADRASAPVSIQAALAHHPHVVMGDTPYIGIYCDAVAHHDDLWLVAAFTPQVVRGEVHWGRGLYYPTRNGDALWIGTPGQTGLVGSERADANDASLSGKGSEFRFTHKLRCGHCSLEIPRRSDQINKDMAHLFAAGVLELSLPAYVATVTSRTGRR